MPLFPLYKEPGWASLGDSHVNYFYLSFGFLVIEQAFEFYLSYRQRRCLKKPEPPAELLEQAKLVDEQRRATEANVAKSTTDKEEEKEGVESVTFFSTIQNKFNKGQAYNLEKNSFSFVSQGYSLLTTTVALLAGLTPFLWYKSSSIGAAVGLGGGELVTSAVFLLINSLLDTVISLPISYYSTFVVEQKHGFNKTTQWTFWTDLIKGIFVGNIISVPLMLAVVKLVRWGGEYFYIYVWGLLVVFSILMLTIYPTLIMPLFNKYTPLEEGTLKEKINGLADRLGFPLKKIYEVDGSRRSSHSNAYLYGFFKDKRIVLFDTLFRKPKKDANATDTDVQTQTEEELDLVCTDEEVVGILAHELGHWKLSHTLKGFFLQQGISFAMLALFSNFVHNHQVYLDFGMSSQPVVIGLTLFFHLMSPLSNVLGLAMNTLTRMFEFQADGFAVKLGKIKELKSGLLKISISNLGSFDVDWLFHVFHHSHPTVVERLSQMDTENRKIKAE